MVSSLKHALSRIRHGGHKTNVSDGNVASDAASSASEKGEVHVNGTSSPRASIQMAREKLNGASPRNSKTFSRADRVGTEKSNKPSVAHSPVRAVKKKLHIGGGDDSSSDGEGALFNRDGERMSKNQIRKAEQAAEKEERRKRVAEKDKRELERRKAREEQLLKEEPAELRQRYGDLPVNNYAGDWKAGNRDVVSELGAAKIGQEVTFRARIHNMRLMSAHLVFFVFRQQTHTVQGVLQEADDVSGHFLFWAEHTEVESVVIVKGIVQPVKAKQGSVIGATIHDCEILIKEMHLESKVTEHLPFTVDEANFSRMEAEVEGEKRQVIPDRVRMANRVIDLRTPASQSIFRVQAGLCHLFRQKLNSEGFIEIHTPKLQGGATESGASVFKIDYFGRPAFLAQSPQLAKQMCIASDFGKVYEIGAVFRAENSNTHRHLTEYTGLDLEMAIDEHYHEVLRTLDRTFKYIFKGIYEQYRTEIEIVKRQFPHEDLVWLEETPVIPFAQGIRMLNESGYRNDSGEPLPEDEDMGTKDEIALGKLIKQKYNTDYYILDKFPVSARPFYAMPDPNNPKITNSFDIFLRGQEILSGGQRIHDSKLLLKNLEDWKIQRSTMEDYVQGFEWGAPPHGGGGIGLERMLMLLLSLGDIRHGCLFPRDPKSLPAPKPQKQLRHPEASTMHPPWEGTDRATAGIEFQPLEKLIANYGDATNTSWLEPRMQLWRDKHTGAAVGWVQQDSFAITVGNPLCHESQYAKTIAGYLHFLKKEQNLKPLWLLVGAEMEEVLADNFNWRTFSVAAEQRVNPSDNPALRDSEIQRKIRRAEKEGIKMVDIPLGSEVPQDVRDKVDQRVKDWLAGRKGKQVHLTDIHLWQDMEHREYHYAQEKNGNIAAIVVLAQLSPENGWQIKWALDFPNAPGGTIEMAVIHTLKTIGATGASNATFGGGASASFTAKSNLKGAKVKMLSKAYHAIVSELKLTNKSEFREKLGATEDPIYIAYPPHGLGPSGVRAILSFFEDEQPAAN